MQFELLLLLLASYTSAFEAFVLVRVYVFVFSIVSRHDKQLLGWLIVTWSRGRHARNSHSHRDLWCGFSHWDQLPFVKYVLSFFPWTDLSIRVFQDSGAATHNSLVSRSVESGPPFTASHKTLSLSTFLPKLILCIQYEGRAKNGLLSFLSNSLTD